MDSLGLKTVDGLRLSAAHRAALRPGEPVAAADGSVHHLPRFFYEIESWSAAHELRITAHFRLWELMLVDCREADLLLREFPHYVPCAVTLLARFLEALRMEAGAPVFVSANGGYRSPAHRFSNVESMHQWGTAADIYRVGDSYLDNEKSLDRYTRIATSLGADVFVRPFAGGDDHLHVDLGFVRVTPREFSEAD
ncbi:MAG: hypothetical protein M3Z64_06115 [Verrucomicrobiota bacterium]|nr:hypothetical protein [Verrucomicrobiota bacterium]